MIVTKRKILLERYRSRKTPLVVSNSVIKVQKGKCKDCGEDEINMQDGYKINYGWGTITASTIPVRLFITQNMDDMGMFSDISYSTEDIKPADIKTTYGVLNGDLNIKVTYTAGTPTQYPENATTSTEKLYLRNSNQQDSYYYSNMVNNVLGYTDDKIEDVTSLKLSNRYNTTRNRSDDPKNYWSGFISVDSSTTQTLLTYILNANNSDAVIAGVPVGGSYNQNTGIKYTTNKNIFRTVSYGKCYGCQDSEFENKTKDIFSTSMKYKTEGWNKENIGLSAITKNEMFFGITSPPEVMSDVFIDRGVTSPMEHHLRLNDVSAAEEFSRYGNNFYNIKT